MHGICMHGTRTRSSGPVTKEQRTFHPMLFALEFLFVCFTAKILSVTPLGKEPTLSSITLSCSNLHCDWQNPSKMLFY
jgi:hypothetical protein